jgi:hypothetical protein
MQSFGVFPEVVVERQRVFVQIALPELGRDLLISLWRAKSRYGVLGDGRREFAAKDC